MRVKRFRDVMPALLASLYVGATLLAADSTVAVPRLLADSGKPAQKEQPVDLDAETEAKANALVAEHLPELREVLDRLQRKQPRQYVRAIRDLAKSARKLDLAKKRDEHLYEIEVNLLKAQNQVNLLTARLKVRDNKKDRESLRDAARQLYQAQLERTRFDVELYQDRLQRTRKQLAAAEKRLQDQTVESKQKIQQAYRDLLRKAGREDNK